MGDDGAIYCVHIRHEGGTERKSRDPFRVLRTCTHSSSDLTTFYRVVFGWHISLIDQPYAALTRVLST